MATEVRKTILGPLSPKCSLLADLKAVLQRMLPEDSYLLASGRLHISLTRVVDGQNVMASEFSSKEELIQVLRPSSAAPGRSALTAWDGHTPGVGGFNCSVFCPRWGQSQEVLPELWSHHNGLHEELQGGRFEFQDQMEQIM